MANKGRGFDARRVVLGIVAALVVVAAVLWAIGAFDSAVPEGMRTVYTTDVTDQSGGEFVVREPQAGEVAVDIPDTAMTPAPAEDIAAPAGE